MREFRQVDPDEVGREIDDILSGAEYQERDSTVIERVFDWIGDRIEDLLPDNLGLGGSGPGNIVAIVVLAALLAGVVYLVAKFWRAPKPVRESDGDDVVYGTESHLRPEVWRAEADRLAAAGDYRGAIRCRHQALLATWLETDTVEHEPGRTASATHAEARRRAGLAVGDPAHEQSLRVARIFDDVWYGEQPATAADERDFGTDARQLEMLRAGRASATAEKVGT